MTFGRGSHGCVWSVNAVAHIPGDGVLGLDLDFGPVGEPVPEDGAGGDALGVEGVSANFGEVVVDEPGEGARLVGN